jgi:hypothetical protein
LAPLQQQQPQQPQREGGGAWDGREGRQEDGGISSSSGTGMPIDPELAGQ